MNYFAFNEMDGLDTFPSSLAAATTDVTIPDVCRAGFEITQTNEIAYRYIPLGWGLREFWLHFMLRFDASYLGTTGGTIFNMSDAGTNFLYLYFPGGNGTTSSSDFTWFFYPPGGPEVVLKRYSRQVHVITFDISVSLTAQGHIRIFEGGGLAAEYIGDLSGVQPLRRIGFGRSGSGGGSARATRVSQVLLSDLPTIGSRVHTLPIAAASSPFDWDGDVADINGTGYNPANAISTAAPGDARFAVAPMQADVLDGNVIVAAGVNYLAKKSASDVPLELAAVAETPGGVTAGAPSVLQEFVQAHTTLFPVNPDTEDRWSREEIDASDFGLRTVPE